MAELIDLSAWERREIYEFFAPMSDPFYALTFPVEVTRLREKCKAEGLSFYMAMTFAVTKAMERVDAFLYKDRGGVIVKHRRLVPALPTSRRAASSSASSRSRPGTTWRSSAAARRRRAPRSASS